VDGPASFCGVNNRLAVYAQEKADNRLASFPQDRGVYFRIKKNFSAIIVYMWVKFPLNPFLISENGKEVETQNLNL
jgi:hypothetical protein